MGGNWSAGGFYEYISLLQSGFQVPVNSGINLQLTGQDMRGFRSYYLYQNAMTTGPAAYVAVRANARWFNGDEALANTTNSSLREDYEWWASTSGVAPGPGQEAVFSGILEQQDQCHGGQLSLSWFNPGPSNITMDYALYGSTRPVDRYFQQMSPYDDTLYENAAIAIAAFGNYVIPLPMYYGRLGVHRENIAAAGNNCVLIIRWGSDTNNFAYHTMNSNAVDGNPQNLEIIAPRRPALITLNNQGGAAVSNRLFITTQRDRA